MIDSHCHLNLDHFEDDQEITIGRALNDGVTGFMNIGYDRSSLRQTLEQAGGGLGPEPLDD